MLLPLAVLTVTLSLCASFTSIASAHAVPPGNVTAKSLALDAATAARAGNLEQYVTTLAETLDDAIKGKTGKVASKFATSDSGTLALLQWRLLARIGATDRAALGTQHPNEMAWLLSSREALEMFLSSGDVQDNRWGEATRVLCTLAAKDASIMDERSSDDLPIRLAIATALVFSTPVKCMADGSDIDPVKRYQSYLAWDREGLLFSSFHELNAWELRYVVGSWSTDEDLVWARANIKPELKLREKVGDGAHMLAYNGANKSGVSVQAGAKFYDNKPMTMAIMLEYGGVCGAISRFGTSMSQAFGVPAMPIGQPGHCAFVWQKSPHSWSINNDISEWSDSGCHSGITIPWGQSAWFVPLMQLAQSDPAHFAESEVLRSCALIADSDARAAILAQACDECPQNFAAWQERVVAMKADGVRTSMTEWKSAFKSAADAFVNHPRAFSSLLISAQSEMLADKPTPKARIDFAIDAARVFAAMARNGADATLLTAALREVLVEQAMGLATNSQASAKNPSAPKAARALVVGDDAKDATLNDTIAMKVIDMTIRAASEFDIAPTGNAHDAWASSLSSLIRGISWQAPIREDGLQRVQQVLAALMVNKREGDARWFADRIVESAKATKDAAFEAKAVEFRASLG